MTHVTQSAGDNALDKNISHSQMSAHSVLFHFYMPGFVLSDLVCPLTVWEGQKEEKKNKIIFY